MFSTVTARWTIGVGVALLLASCGGSDPEGTAATDPSAASADVSPDSTGRSDEAAPVALAEWQRIKLIDADGETFALADLLGRPVFVETFATWCGNCRRQLGDTNRAAEQAGDDAVFVALSVETDLDRDDMADYADEQGFDHIRFAVMSPEMLAAVNDAFGNTALNPPSTPHVTVAPDGTVGELVTGYDSPESILSALGLA